MMKRYFCSLPFEHFEVNEHGDVWVCCPARLPKAIGNLLESSLMDVWNSKAAQEIRGSVFDNSYKFCIEARCGALQSGKLPEIHDVKLPYFKELIEKRMTILNDGPRRLNLGYDRTCNLACTSCRKQQIVFTGERLEKARMMHS